MHSNKPAEPMEVRQTWPKVRLVRSSPCAGPLSPGSTGGAPLRSPPLSPGLGAPRPLQEIKEIRACRSRSCSPVPSGSSPMSTRSTTPMHIRMPQPEPTASTIIAGVAQSHRGNRAPASTIYARAGMPQPEQEQVRQAVLGRGPVVVSGRSFSHPNVVPRAHSPMSGSAASFPLKAQDDSTIPGPRDVLPGLRDVLPGQRDVLPGPRDVLPPKQQPSAVTALQMEVKQMRNRLQNQQLNASSRSAKSLVDGGQVQQGKVVQSLAERMQMLHLELPTASGAENEELLQMLQMLRGEMGALQQHVHALRDPEKLEAYPQSARAFGTQGIEAQMREFRLEVDKKFVQHQARMDSCVAEIMKQQRLDAARPEVSSLSGDVSKLSQLINNWATRHDSMILRMNAEIKNLRHMLYELQVVEKLSHNSGDGQDSLEDHCKDGKEGGRQREVITMVRGLQSEVDVLHQKHEELEADLASKDLQIAAQIKVHFKELQTSLQQQANLQASVFDLLRQKNGEFEVGLMSTASQLASQIQDNLGEAQKSRIQEALKCTKRQDGHFQAEASSLWQKLGTFGPEFTEDNSTAACLLQAELMGIQTPLQQQQEVLKDKTPKPEDLQHQSHALDTVSQVHAAETVATPQFVEEPLHQHGDVVTVNSQIFNKRVLAARQLPQEPTTSFPDEDINVSLLRSELNAAKQNFATLPSAQGTEKVEGGSLLQTELQKILGSERDTCAHENVDMQVLKDLHEELSQLSVDMKTRIGSRSFSTTSRSSNHSVGTSDCTSSFTSDNLQQ